MSVSKIVTREQIKAISESRRAAGDSIVFTNGCFDVVHPGHVYCLYEARRKGDALVVGLNSDSSVKKLKGPSRPVFPQDERAELLAAFFFVDYVVIFDEETPLNLVVAVRPHVLVKGGDYSPETIVGRKEVEEDGGELVTIPPLPGLSSSNLIKLIGGE